MRLETERFLSNRVKAKLARGLHEVNRMAKQLEKSGHKVVRLAQGEPDFDTPAHIKRAAEQALAKGMTHYSPVEGLDEVRLAVAGKIQKDLGISYAADKEIEHIAPSVRALKIFDIAQVTTTKTLQFRHAVLGPG
jgi:aspartate/methionine/tyrosine aminotransferase